MKRYLVNFYTKEFKEGHDNLKKSALKFGIDEVISFTPKDLENSKFYLKNREILDQKRGAGYWLWKPYIILETLKKIEADDILVYADSGIEIIKHLNPLFAILERERNILNFSCGEQINKDWTKRDCFILMDCDNEKYWDSEQRLASFHLYKKNSHSIKLLEDWLRYGEDKRIISDIENTQKHENFLGFVEHRHDQSIFSLLLIKNEIEMYRDPTQWGNYLKLPEFREDNEFIHREYSLQPFINSPYGTILNHHRKRKRSLFVKIKKMKKIFKYLKIILPLIVIHKYKKIDGWLTSSEAVALYRIAKRQQANSTVVEIGSWKGKSTFCIAKGLKKQIRLIAIDPFNYFGEPGSKEEYEKRNTGIEPIIEFTNNMKEAGLMEKIEIKKGLSESFVNKIDDIDLLFIDGDHSVEGCRFDYESYSPKIKEGGYLIFHDYDTKRKDLGPTWVIENLVIPSKKFEKIGTYDSLCVFKKLK